MIRIILAFLNVAGNFFSNAQLFKLCVFQANPPTVERVSLYLWGFTTQVIDKKVLFIIIIFFFLPICSSFDRFITTQFPI